MCGGGGVGGVAGQDHAAGVPAAEFNPFNRPEVNLVVALQGGEVGRDWAAEALEPLPEPFQAAGRRIVGALPVQAGEPVGAPVTDRDQAEVTALAGEDHQMAGAGGRAGMTLRQLTVSAYWGGTGLTARRRTVELMPSAPTIRS